MENASLQTVEIDTICTFASPRVGYAAFVSKFDALPITSWRIRNMNDFAPKVPPELIGYRHVDVGFEFSSTAFAQSSLACCHDMLTYQHELDPRGHALRPSCAIAPAAAAMFMSKAAKPSAPRPDFTAAGAVTASVVRSDGKTTMSVQVTVDTSELS